MVAGDLVNTAARLQSVAQPGTVLVGESTMRAASAAIAFEPAGEQTLKGKTAPVPAYRALRVVAQRGGSGRSDLPEPPFVGRDEELRLLKDLIATTGRDRRTRLVSITGPGGIGKSRLAWELEKYIDGIIETIYWHRGRSPAYGEGITFWALGEMVRRRAGLAETDDEATTRERIGATVAEYVPGEDDRRWVEPALLTLLGLEAGAGRRSGRPLRRVADLLRADRRAVDHGAPVRGPPVGRLRPARLHRAPARVVEERAADRRDAGPAGAVRPPPRLGQGDPEPDQAGPRAAHRRRDAAAPRRLRARACRSRRSRRSSPAPTGCRSTPSRRSARSSPTAASSATATRTGRSASSASWPSRTRSAR